MHHAQKASTTIAVLTCTLFAAGTLLAPATAHATSTKFNSYAVKVVCEEDGDTEVETDVNIHNPNWGSTKEIFWTLSPAYDYMSDRRGESIGPYRGEISRNETISVDCEVLMYETECLNDGFEFEGFFIVLSTVKLNVVGVYEVAETGNGEETEEVDVVPVAPNTVTVSNYKVKQWRNSTNGARCDAPQ